MNAWKLFVFLGLFISVTAQAGMGPFTLGAMIGDPTGVSGKYDLAGDQALDAGFAWSMGSRSGIEIHGDFLQVLQGQVTAGDTDLDLYYGIGARLISIGSGDDRGKIVLGPRAPLGLLHHLRENPSVEFFGEVALVLDLIPSTAADLDLLVGVRYRF